MELLAPSDPRVVGPYRPRAVLGQGGMGRVYLATGPSGERVAVKLVRDMYSAQDPGFRSRLRREADAARRVRSPRTAQVVAADTEAAIPWVAYEFRHGPSLSHALQVTGPLPEDSVLYLARGLAEALRDIHTCEFVHRDLSTGNVLLGADGPVVIDFGIARNAAAGGDAGDVTTVTRPGTLVGAPGFMSPEQAMGLDLTPVSDIFSLGTILLTAATGTNPFRDTSPSETRRRVIETTPQATLRDERLRAVVDACLVKDPGGRATADGLLAMLAGLPAPPPGTWPEAVRRIATEQQEQVYWLTHGDPSAPLPGPQELDPAMVFGPPSAGAPQPVQPPPAPRADVIDAVPPAGPAFSPLPSQAGPWSGATPAVPVPGQLPGAGPAPGEYPAVRYPVPAGPPSGQVPVAGAPDPAADVMANLAAYHHQGRADIGVALPPRRRGRTGLWIGAGIAAVLVVLVVLSLTVFRGLLPVPPPATPVAATPSADVSPSVSPSPTPSPTVSRNTNPEAGEPEYLAEEGECVHRDPEKETVWGMDDKCGVGSFEVARRIEGEKAAGDCSRGADHEKYFGPSENPGDDVLLCLTLNYPGDAWKTEKGDCVHRPGPVDSYEFEIVDCDSKKADGRVLKLLDVATRSGREAGKVCPDGTTNWTSWHLDGFDESAYTMCYKKL
ncbi:serine/threonine protein kinase [Myceligenerans crystallogenes]|uniref:Protein kinase domain-containing protein n=1 Tax=Myceligenerans crystallogenes TaxID=316335 RepID=A0ABP4ZV14_9MICO